MNAFRRIEAALFQPVDIAALVAFRVIFGTLMAYDTARYVAFGWVRDHYLAPTMLFKFMGFEWVKRLPDMLLLGVFGIMVAAAICMALGLCYRLSALLFFLGHTYVFLLAAELYLNHGYLISVLSFVMIMLPAHRALSFDATADPTLYARRIPAWPIWVLRSLILVLFVYGSLAKMNTDWLSGEPLRHWLAQRANTSFIGGLLVQEGAVVLVCAYGIVFDLLVVPMLLWHRTRWLAVVASLAFHLSNAYLFNIGIFPWLMIGSITLFFDGSWPRRLPVYGTDIDRYLNTIGAPDKGAKARVPIPTLAGRQRVLAFLSVFSALMWLVPLRHHLYPGKVAWSDEGHMFSWRMKLRQKNGRIDFQITDPKDRRQWTVHPSGDLTDRQVHKMVGRPDFVLQYAHFLRDRYALEHGMDVEVRCNAFVSLNFRAEQRFIDPKVDLAKRALSIRHYDFLLPFVDLPLPGPPKRLVLPI